LFSRASRYRGLIQVFFPSNNGKAGIALFDGLKQCFTTFLIVSRREKLGKPVK